MTEAGCQYICRDGDNTVAAFGLIDKPQGNYQEGSWSQTSVDGSYMDIHALAIHSLKQGRGIGTEIIHFCIDKAKAENYKAIRVDIVPTKLSGQESV